MPLTISLQGQVGLVTGAGTPHGIGRSMVLSLSEAGAKCIYACDLNISAIPSLQEEIRATGSACIVEARLLDVSEEEATISLLKEIVKAHGRFDFYFANAGFANYRCVEIDVPEYHVPSASFLISSA
jgi:3-oxoacyl-[acyl-carrier protein] reductase